MNNKMISIGLGALLVVIAGSVVFYQESFDSYTPPPVPSQATTTASVPTTPVGSPETGITSDGVAMHNTRQSCWSTINGSVYDLTSWIPQHPGGEEGILKLCGIDGSESFNKKHGGAVKQATVLAGFKIGTAAQ